jgi:hypothetical protein
VSGITQAGLQAAEIMNVASMASGFGVVVLLAEGQLSW